MVEEIDMTRRPRHEKLHDPLRPRRMMQGAGKDAIPREQVGQGEAGERARERAEEVAAAGECALAVAGGCATIKKVHGEQIRELADAIYADKVRRARAMQPSKKMGLGADLFAEVCGRMRAGIRSQFPEASASEIEGILRKRLDRLSAIEDAGIFRKVDFP